MAFKMRCPKCFGLDYSIERDNRTFGAVAQAFELVFHCRCGKQLFGETLLKEYERQKKEFETGGSDEATGNGDERSRALERAARAAEENRGGRRGDDLEDGEDEEDEDAPKEDRRWRERMAALTADDGDDDDEKPSSPAHGRTRAGKKPAAATKSFAALDESVPAASEVKGGRAVDDGSAGSGRPSAAAESAPAKKTRAAAKSSAKATKSADEDGVKAAKKGAARSAAKAAEPAAEPAEPETNGAGESAEADPSSTLCLWPGCKNPRRENSKYCSRACSNKNARLRHKQRGKKPRKKSGDNTVAA